MTEHSDSLSPRSLRLRFVHNTAAGLGFRAFQLLVNSLFIVYVIRSLGLEQWGLLTFSLSFVTVLSLVTVGSSAGVAKRLTYAAAKGDRHSYAVTYSNSVFLVVAAAALTLLLVALVSAAVFGHLVVVDVDTNAYVLVLLVVTSSLLSLLSLPQLGVLNSIHRLYVYSIALAAGLTVRCVIVVSLFTAIRPSVYIYGAALVLESLVTAVIITVYAQRAVSDARFSRRQVSRAEIRSMIAYNGSLLLNQVNYVAYIQVPVLALGWYGSIQSVGIYGIYIQISSITRGLVGSVTTSLSPIYQSLVAEGDESQGIRDVYVLSSKLYLAFSLLGVGLFYVWGLPLLEAVLPESRGFGDDIFVLFLATAVGIIAMPSALLNDSMEQSLRPGVVGVLACAAMVGVMAIQGRADGLTLGAVGYALVTFFSFYQLYRVWVAWRALHFSLVGGFRVVVAPGLPAVVGSMLLLAAAELGLRAELHLAVPLTLSVLALAVFALALFRVGLSGPERTAAKSSVLRLTRRRRGGAQASFPEGVDGG